MQQSEVQEVTFSAGMGLGGSATLTYTDLYGQSWTTRPIALGEAHHYVLEYALGNGATAANCWLALSYGGTAAATGIKSQATLTAQVIRKTILGMSPFYTATADSNLARSVRVVERPDMTSHKFQNGIQANTKKTFDIYITVDPFSGVKENGGLNEFTANLVVGSSSNTAAPTAGGATDEIGLGNAYVAVTSAADASAAIKDALEGLPNNVIPAVTVTKADYTTGNTADRGNYGNSFHQSYRITFSSSSNTGDQNMLSCDASACDHDGCTNRKAGVSSVTYLHSDWSAASPSDGQNANTTTRKSPRINFNGAGYFVVDVHRNKKADPTTGDFSSGELYVDWNTGSGVERATFSLIATAATAQTALRGITGWSGVTVASSCGGSACTGALRTEAHAYTVEFPTGYDDGGQTPLVGIVGTYGGKSGVDDDGAVVIVDQRFSNSLFLGDITGWQKVACVAGVNTAGAGNEKTFIDSCSAASDSTMQLQEGDNFKLTNVHFGYVSASTVGNSVTGDFETLHSATGVESGDLGFSSTIASADAFVRINYDADRPTTTSIDTGDYFAVGATIEVLDTTWDLDDTNMADVSQTTNKYRSFKVLSHVKNTFGHTFAKLDSTPTSDSVSNYALKVTSNNYTVTTRKNIELSAVQNEVQSIRAFTGSILKMSTVAGTDAYRLYINKDKPNVEFTEVLDGASTEAEVQEAINAFSVLSGPVLVTRSGTGAAASGFAGGELIITFAAIDGDVPQIEAVKESGSIAWVSLTQHEGWSFFAGKGSRLESVEPGAIINITSRETVTFAVGSLAAGSSLVFSYDGNVGATAIAHGAVTAANVFAALNSIKDHKGAAKFTFEAGDITGAGNGGFAIEMPEGVDGSKLGLSPADGAEVATISKSVAKNNNGKSFKVVRVENNKQSLANTGATKTTLAFASIHNIVTDFAIALDDEIRWTQTVAGIPCQLVDAAGAAAATPVKDVYLSAVSYDLAGSKTDLTTTETHASQNLATGCSASIHRTTIVVDAMPDAMSARTTGANVEVEIKGAAGSCSVTEAVKGTYESDVCSSRGNCDGAAGLCTCHEGYSGEACETQTVLV
jgi:hypothetical protein